MNADVAFEIIDRVDDETGTIFTMRWRFGSADPISFILTSGAGGVVLKFGPTIAVSSWPAWLRGMTMFGAEGGRAAIRLDPSLVADPQIGRANALDLRDRQARASLIAFSAGAGDALKVRYAEPSPNEGQAIAVCAGLARAFNGSEGIVPVPALLPALFLPSALPILVDDINDGPARQHVRLTYRLPRLSERWVDACSLRLFQSKRTFGVEFRALPDDGLPSLLRPACIHDDLGPLLRFSIDRGSGETVFLGNAKDAAALRLIRAIVRQVSRDLTPPEAPTRIPGFSASHWRHWFAALPDLLATRAANPLGAYSH